MTDNTDTGSRREDERDTHDGMTDHTPQPAQQPRSRKRPRCNHAAHLRCIECARGVFVARPITDADAYLLADSIDLGD